MYVGAERGHPKAAREWDQDSARSPVPGTVICATPPVSLDWHAKRLCALTQHTRDRQTPQHCCALVRCVEVTSTRPVVLYLVLASSASSAFHFPSLPPHVLICMPDAYPTRTEVTRATPAGHLAHDWAK